jgi:WD40 repeat protein
MMVAVGDSNEVFLFDVRRDNYHQVSTLKGGEDAGFSTCWNQSGSQFAVASQDGRVNIWDVRVLSKRLASLRCTQASIMACVDTLCC